MKIRLFICGCLLWSLSTPVFAFTPDDPFFSDQWYLSKIQAPEAWDMEQGKTGTVVAVLDAGVDMNHPDLLGRFWNNPGEIPDNGLDDDGNGFVDDVHGYNFVDKNANPEPPQTSLYDEGAISHGTMIAGIIGANTNNGVGVAGIDRTAKLMVVRILDNMGIGDSVTARKGIDYAVANGAKVINLSFTGFDFDAEFQAAIERAHDAGVVVVAAVGNTKNGGTDINQKPIYPACFQDHGVQDWVLGVAATDQADTKTSFSNYGSSCTDISAPGVGILNTVYQNDVWLPFSQGFYQDGWSGTSLAAPIVSAAAGLLFQEHPNITPNQVYTILRSSVDPVFMGGLSDGSIGSGRINIAKALTLANEQFPPEATPGMLIKLMCALHADVNDPCKAVYFYGADKKRHAFPNDKVYFSWYPDFSTVKEVSSDFLSSLMLGKNVTYHPGLKLVKFQSVPTVYTVEAKGVLRSVASEQVAQDLYGATWSKQVDDISDAFFGNYQFGATILSSGDFAKDAVFIQTPTLNQNF